MDSNIIYDVWMAKQAAGGAVGAATAPIIRGAKAIAPKAKEKTVKFLAQALKSIKAHPFKSSFIGGATLAGGGSLISDMLTRKKQDAPKQMPDISSMSDSQMLNTTIGGATALTGAMILNAALKNTSGLKRNKALRYALAGAGGLGLGYLGWKASDNFQKNT